MRRKFWSVVLSICLVLTLFPGISYATGETGGAMQTASFPDIEGHWAREAIQKALADGYVKGYPDGRFLPERPVSRAEFVSMVNNALQLRSENKVKLGFSDVKKSDWFGDEVAKAGYVRYIKGTSATTFSPESVITRQEAALMLSRFLPKEGMQEKAILDNYPDRASIEAWAEEGMAVTVNKGYMKGHTNGTLAPLGTLTRAEAVTLIGQILANETIVREDVFVKESGDILRDKIYVGDITIAEEVGEGDATLQNLSALSVVYVNGGGSHTVTMENSLIIRLVVTKEGTQVRVLAADGTTIYTSILFNNNLLVDEQGDDAQPDGEAFEDIVVIQGAVTEEQARQIAASISEQVQSGNPVTPQQVTQAVQSVLTNSTARTDESGTIVVEVPVTPVTGGGGRDNRPQVTSVAVSGETDYITATVAAVAAPTEATVAYQWLRSASASGTYTAISGATSAEYTITEDDIGFFLKASATGTGTYSGTQTSAALGPVGFAGGSGTEANPYQVANWYHLDNMRHQLDKDFLLTEDLGPERMYDSYDASMLDYETTGYLDVVTEKDGYWEPVGQFPEVLPESLSIRSLSADPDFSEAFTGTFDGNGKLIRELRVDRPDVPDIGSTSDFDYACGLFGVLYNAEVSDLEFQYAYVRGTDYVGSLAGYSRKSTISNIVNGPRVSDLDVRASRIDSGVYGDTRIGGIVGRNDAGTVEDCYNDRHVAGGQYVGGIAGSNYVEQDLGPAAMGLIPSETAIISNSENEGDVQGYAYVGGIAGGNGYSLEISEGDYAHGTDTPAYIRRCISTAYVEFDPYYLSYTGVPMKLGGIAGGSTGTISESIGRNYYVGGDGFAVGGIAGSTNGIVENCYNESSVNGAGFYGGIVGYAKEAVIRYNYNLGLADYYAPSALTSGIPSEICGEDGGEEPSVFTANFYPVSMELGMLGVDVDGIYGVSPEEMRNPLTFREREPAMRDAAPEAWDFDTVWAMNLQDQTGYPFLRWEWNEDDFRPVTLEVTMPVPISISLGQTLADATLEGGEVSLDGVGIPGAFSYWDAYNDPNEVTPGDDGMTAYVLFTPDSELYDTFVGTVFVEVESLYLGEPNDAPETATPLIVGEAQAHHWIMPETDTDWFSFEAEANQLYRIMTFELFPAGDDDQWMDTYINLYADPTEDPVRGNDDYASLGAGILWNCSASGTYYVHVMHYDHYNESVTEDSTGRYDILVREENPGAALVNGGFETGNFDGWDVGRSGQYPIVQDDVVRSGVYAAHLSDGAEGMYAPGNSAMERATSRLVQTFALQDEAGIPMVSFYYYITDTDVEEDPYDWLEAWLYYPESDLQVYLGSWYEATGEWKQFSYLITDSPSSIVELHIQAATEDDSVTNDYYLDDVGIEYLTEDNMLQDEPNDDPDTATPLELDQPVARWIYPFDDYDAWTVDLTEGERYEIRTRDLYPEYEGGGAFMTTNLQIGTIGELMAESSSLTRWDEEGVNESYLSFVAPETGSYLILVSPDHPDWAEGNYGRYTLSIEQWAPPSMGTAVELEPGEALNGDIQPSTDIEWYKFNAEAGTPYLIRTTDLDPPTSEMFYMVTYMSLYDSDGTVLLASSDSNYDSGDGGDESSIEYTFEEAGEYYITVEHRYSEFEEAIGTYRILLESMMLPATETPVIDAVGWNAGNLLVQMTGSENANLTLRSNGLTMDYLNELVGINKAEEPDFPYYVDYAETDPGFYEISAGPVLPGDHLSFCLTEDGAAVSAAVTYEVEAGTIPVDLIAAGLTGEEDHFVTFDDDEVWRNAVTGVWADGVELDPALYEFAAGQLVIDNAVAAFDSAIIFVEATGYISAYVMIGSPD